MVKDCTSLCQALNARYSATAGRSICAGVVATLNVFSGLGFFKIGKPLWTRAVTGLPGIMEAGLASGLALREKRRNMSLGVQWD